MSEYAIHVDDWNGEHWYNHGYIVMRELMLTEGTPQHEKALERAKGCGFDLEEVVDEFAEDHTPMMLYAYPLEFEPSEDEIAEVCERTACTVMENEETGEFFLALCGGGMNLSQDVALAYNIVQTWLPISLLENVSKQKGLSKDGEDFEQIRKIIIEQAKMEGEKLLRLAEDWTLEVDG